MIARRRGMPIRRALIGGVFMGGALISGALVGGALIGGAGYAAGRNSARLHANGSRQHQPQVLAPSAPSASGDFADKVTKLGDMVSRDLLTPEEFTAAKAKLLAQ